MKKFILTLTLFVSTFSLLLAQEDETLVLIKTNFGELTVKLYNETPKHRDNFIKLVEDGFYNDLLFHRVINQFMIQGGDPDSRGADSGAVLGNGGLGYTLPAEIKPTLYHKKGALAAARLGDNINPEKESSGSQFYIVHGKIFLPEDLEKLTRQKNMQLRQKAFSQFLTDTANIEYKMRFKKIQQARDMEAYKVFVDEVTPMLDEIVAKTPDYFFTEKMINSYTTIGGAPHLDGDYTVFGEIVEGLEVIDAIAAVKTDNRNRPFKDVVIEKMKVVKK